MPATPPQVTFQNGQLAIVAHNSTLGDILRAVHAQTGANVDVPANATERVVSQLGPGPAREVLASLLNGSHFNYLMLGSAANPDSLERVILTPKAGAASAPGTVYASNPTPDNFVPPPPPPLQVQEAQDEDASGDLADDETLDSDESQQEGQPNQGENPQPNPNQPRVKTPEQLLQELQRQQIQQQQQQQQPPQSQPNQPPQ
jgi:hypothetical protein